MNTRGILPEIVRNDKNVYKGDLVHYFRVIFYQVRNLNLPFHNFRHMSHVLFLCYDACLYYGASLSVRQKRNLLIAALFHDFNHSGKLGNDDQNIAEALRGLDEHVLPEDRPELTIVAALVQATEYPHKNPAEELELPAQILRDADSLQTFSEAWIQQVIFGLAAEWGKKPIEILAIQLEFLANLKLHTAWGRQRFPQSVINEKAEEARQLFEILR
jgi:hypothetical protein